MLKFRDFVPRQVQAPGFLTAGEYDSFELAASSAANWIQNKSIKLYQIETVVLPNMHSNQEEGSRDPSLRTSGEMSSTWHQFLRVWYFDEAN